MAGSAEQDFCGAFNGDKHTLTFNCGSCSDIVISGGTVTADDGQYGAGIGSGHNGSCGTITIDSGANVIQN